MAISLRGVGATAVNTKTPNPSYPAGVQANDLNVLTIVAKPTAGNTPDDMILTQPSGWRMTFDTKNGSNPPSSPPAATGSVRVWVLTRTGSAFSGSIGAISISNCSVAAAGIDTYAGSLGTGWSTAASRGYDVGGSTYDSNFSMTASNQLHTTNDWLLAATGFSDDAGLGTATLTATGATLGTVTARRSTGSAVASPVAECGIDVRDAPVTAGTSSAGPRLTGTANNNGVSVFFRLREGVTSLSSSDARSILDRSSLGATDTVPTPRDWMSDDPLDAETLNAAFRDPIAWVLTEAPGIQLEATAAVTFAATTHTITWNTTPRYRRGSIVLNGTKVSVPATGYYIGEFSVGVKDIDAMLLGWLLTVDVLMYPGGTGTANVQNVSTNFTDMDTEMSFTVGSIPFSMFLNAGDAIEVRMSGAWGTTADTGLLVDLPTVGILMMLDLHWESFWEGGVV